METTQQIVREDPAIEAYKLDLLKQAKALAFNEGRTPLAEQLPGYAVEGFTDPQKTAINAATTQGIGAFDPYLTSANQAVTQAYGTTGEAANVLRGADTRDQYLGAQNVLTAGIGAMTQGAGQYDPAMAAQFMNPYQTQVTQQALAEMRRQGDIARQGAAAQAVKSGAFGSTREGVQRAEMERGLQDVMSQRIFQDYAQNYGRAQRRKWSQSGRGQSTCPQAKHAASGDGDILSQSHLGTLAKSLALFAQCWEL